jgi:Glycosyl transferase family 2
MPSKLIEEAIAAENAGLPFQALQKWKEAARAETRRLPIPKLRSSAPLIQELHPKISVPTDLHAFLASASTQSVLELVDELDRVRDLRNMVRLHEASGPGIIRDYIEFGLFAAHQCHEPLLSLTPQLLERLPKALPEEQAAHWRKKILIVSARSAMTVGDQKKALMFLNSDETLRLSSPDIFLQILWRSDPGKAMEYSVRTVFSGRRGSRKADNLFCYIPLLCGDPASARANIELQYVRYAALKKRPSRELVVCDAAIAAGERDWARMAGALRAYFKAFGLSSPLPETIDPVRPFFDQLHAPTPEKKEGGPLVTVLMTAYNSAQTIGYALRSILDQNYRNIEVIVVDDASSDETGKLLAEFERTDKRVKLIRNDQNGGTYVSKNRALKIAKGRYFTCHDADDWAHPKRIETHVDLMESKTSSIVSLSYLLRLDASGVPQPFRRSGVFTHGNSASAFYRLQPTLEKVGFYDAIRAGADSEHYWRATAVFGTQALWRIKAPLTLAKFHLESLTRSGTGAMTDEDYSKPRSDYRLAALRWQMKNIDQGLRLDPEIDSGRSFYAPDGL